MGTASYMPPEQATGKGCDRWELADVYSLGAVLYATLTGRPPFQAATAAETQRQLIEEDPVSPRLLNSATPRDLETICLKCLQKDPTRRYATAAELAADCGRFVRLEPILARPVGRSERAGAMVSAGPHRGRPRDGREPPVAALYRRVFDSVDS